MPDTDRKAASESVSIVVAVLLLITAILIAAAVASHADQPKPPPLRAVPLSALTPLQIAKTQQTRATIQGIYDKMDMALQLKKPSDLLAHRDPTYAEIDCHGAWRSASNCRAATQHLFTGLLSANKRSVVHTITLNGKLAEVYVSRHGSLIALDPRTKLYANTLVDAVCRDIFEYEGDHWVQYRSYTLAEQVYVNGKHVPS